MKRNIFPLLALALIALFVFIGCSKKDSNSNSNAITQANLVGSYTLTVFTVTVPPLAAVNALDSLLPCERDDIYKLNPDLTYNYIDAGTQCSPPGDGSGTWSLLSADSIVIDSQHAKIVSYDGKNLMISETVVENGFTGIVTQTLTKQ